MLQDQRFAIQAELSADAFAHSLGVNRGTPEKIAVLFAPQIRKYVRERNWHTSQKLQDLPDESLRMTLNVCTDSALRTGILGFGAFVKVESPSWLAQGFSISSTKHERPMSRASTSPCLHARSRFDYPRLPGIRSSRPS